MIDRAIHALICKIKLGDKNEQGWKNGVEALAALYEFHLLRAARHLLHGGAGGGAAHVWEEELARRAAAIALDYIRACSVYYVSRRMDGFLLNGALVSLNHERALPEDVQEAVKSAYDVDIWFPALLDLITLSRRVWTHVQLRVARGAAHGDWGPFADLCLGRTDAGEPRYSLLTGDRHRLATAHQELDSATEERRFAKASDPVEEVLGQLSAAFRDPAAPTEGHLLIAQHVLTTLNGLPNAGHWTSPRRYPTLADALNDIVKHLCPNPALVMAAMDDFFRETASPGTVLVDPVQASVPNLLAHLLNVLPPTHNMDPAEPAPDIVLSGIASIPVSTVRPRGRAARRALPLHLNRPQLVAIKLAELEPTSPERLALLSLVMCNGLEGTLALLRRSLPGPSGMLNPDHLLREALAVLRHWDALLGTLAAGTATEDVLEVPMKFRHDPKTLGDAIRELDSWLADPSAAPATWAAVAARGVAEAILSGLRTVLLDRLHQNLKQVYGAFKRYRTRWKALAKAGPVPVPPFDELILVPAWGAAATVVPSPQEVRRRLRDIEAILDALAPLPPPAAPNAPDGDNAGAGGPN